METKSRQTGGGRIESPAPGPRRVAAKDGGRIESPASRRITGRSSTESVTSSGIEKLKMDEEYMWI